MIEGSGNIVCSEGVYASPLIKTVLSDIPMPILVLSEGEVIECNDSAVRLFHASLSSDLTGRSLFSLSVSHQPDGSASGPLLEKLLDRIEPGKNFRFEWVFKKSDGNDFDSKVTIRQADPAHGSLLIVTIVDNSAESSAIRRILALAEEAKQGNLRARVSTEGYHGDLLTLMISINSMLNDILHPFRDMSKILVRISNGDIHARNVTSYRGEHEKIRSAVNGLDEVVSDLQKEIIRLTTAAREGRLAERGQPELFKGAYAETINGINQMLDAILTPIRHGNRVLQKISRGDLSERLDLECVGDHEKIKHAINGVHDWLAGLIIYVTRISEGDMSADFSKASEKDQIHGPLIRMRDNIRVLINDVDLLVQAGSAGDLKVRADPSRHQGDFRRIVDGMNRNLDSVIIPIEETMRVSGSYSRYDFTSRINPSLGLTGDWTALKDSLDDVGETVSSAVVLINDQVSALREISSQAEISIKDISQGAASLAEIAQHVSINSEQGGNDINQVLQAIADLAENVSNVAIQTSEVNRLADETSFLSQKGSDLARDAELGMQEITESTSEVVSLFHEIMEEMKKISKISSMISDIASQTNLLALNAAIEAARAGDAGRGFAVVASEVKALALDSRKSAENISEMLTFLEHKTQRASDTMDKGAISVHNGGIALKETLSVFGQILASFSTINEHISDLSRTTEHQAAVVEEIAASVTEVNDLVSGTARDAVASAAATEQAAAAIDQVSDQISEVSVVAGRLESGMEKFRV
ncbi:MAG: methyl-accepting chemotaxis protein [Methanobacteriota archaeon]